MPKPKYHVFVCTNQRPAGHPRGSCAERKSIDLFQKMADVRMQKQLFDTVRLSGVQTCMGPCGQGACVTVYPDNVWYGNVKTDDIEEIFNSHLIQGTPVQRLMIPDDQV